jgi:hypothetical protein
MLTAPDMQARYIGATLAVIQTELDALSLPADGRHALSALVANAAQAAARLADDLEKQLFEPAPRASRPLTCSASRGGNVLAFKTSKRATR